VGVNVDHREFGSRHVRFGYVQHASGLKILERQAGGGWFRGGFGCAHGNTTAQQRGGGTREPRSAVHWRPPAGMPGIGPGRRSSRVERLRKDVRPPLCIFEKSIIERKNNIWKTF
jgi:hypothetical protein